MFKLCLFFHINDEILIRFQNPFQVSISSSKKEGDNIDLNIEH